MRITAKYCVGKYVISDENDKVIGRLRRSFVSAGQLAVYDETGALKYKMKKRDGLIEVLEIGKETLIASIFFAEDSNSKKTKSFLLPPIPEKLVLYTAWGKLVITQTKQREFHIFLDQEKIGILIHIMFLNKIFELHKDKLPPVFYGVILGLVLFLLHEDDVEIV